MREILEEAHAHREDGLGRAQKPEVRELKKRFYEKVDVAKVEGGYTVTLDDRPTRTPGKKPAIVPVLEVAQVMAEEWQAQVEYIDPALMPHLRLMNSGIEGGEDVLADLKAEVLKYAAGDLMYYRAETPKELIESQKQHWDAALEKLSERFDITFKSTASISHQEQPEQTLKALSNALNDVGLFGATAMASITSLTGSGLLAIALRYDLLGAESVWAAGHVDEDFNVRLWGEDFEAGERRRKRRSEFDAAVKVLTLIGNN